MALEFDLVKSLLFDVRVKSIMGFWFYKEQQNLGQVSFYSFRFYTSAKIEDLMVSKSLI